MRAIPTLTLDEGMDTFGDRLWYLMRKRGVTYREIAARVYCDTSTLSAYVTGKRTPQFDIAVGIAKYFGVSLDFLAGLSEEESHDQSISDLR